MNVEIGRTSGKFCGPLSNNPGKTSLPLLLSSSSTKDVSVFRPYRVLTLFLDATDSEPGEKGSLGTNKDPRSATKSIILVSSFVDS